MEQNLKLRVKTHNTFGRALLRVGQHSIKDSFACISLHEFEPSCPFCGDFLHHAECKCANFKDAFNKIVKKLPGKKDLVHVSKNHPEAFNADHIIMTKGKLEAVEQNLADITLDTFLNGSITNTLEVSLAEYKDNKLEFFARMVNGDKVHKFVLTDFSYTRDEPNIYLYTMEQKTVSCPGRGKRMGNYTFEWVYDILQKIPYSDYLDMLCLAFKEQS